MSDRWLRLALLALPSAERERDGDVLLDCAREMVDGGARPAAQAADIAAAGLRLRVARLAGPAAAAPWGAALDRLALPLAGAALVLLATGAAQWHGHGRWWPVMLAAAIAAVLGSALRGRALAVTGWSVLLLADVAALLQQEVQQMGSRFALGTGSLSVDAQAAILPLLVLGLASACAIRPRGRRHLLGGALALAAAAAASVTVRAESTTAWEAPVVGTAIVAAALLLPLVLAAVAAVRRRPRELASATLVLAVAAPELVWIATGLLPYPGPVAALPMLAAEGAAATFLVLRLARRAGRAARA